MFLEVQADRAYTGAPHTLVFFILYEVLPTGQLWWIREGPPDASTQSRGLESRVGGSGHGPRGTALRSGGLEPQGEGVGDDKR